MPSGAQHITWSLALAVCLPKAASVGFRVPRGRNNRFRSSQSSARMAIAGVLPRAGETAQFAGPLPPGGGYGSNGRGGRDDGKSDPEDDSISSFLAWLVSDQGRRAAVAGVSWAAALTCSVQVAQREVVTPAGPQVVEGDGLATFSGVWVLSESQNFDAYLASIGVSPLHRRYACSASVSQTIESRVENGHPALAVQVRNQLGVRSEMCMVDGKPTRSQDVRGDEIVKVTTVAQPADGQRGPVCVTEVRHSRIGIMHERRYLTTSGAMVMELTSPAGVTALRIYKKA